MHPRRYETLVLMAPNLPPEEFDRLKNKLDGIITGQKGNIVRYEDWGRRRLAYPVHKEMYGRYVLYDFQGSPELANELERNLKIEENIYKHLTLILAKKFTDEDLNREWERQASEKARLEAERAKEAEDRAKEAEERAREAEARAAAAEAEQPKEPLAAPEPAAAENSAQDNGDNPASAEAANSESN